jgi:prolyl 4-hydroxylase
MESMLISGWPEDVAAQALSKMANPDGFPAPQVKDKTHITIDGHTMKVVATLKHPKVVVFGNFLTPQECEALCEEATPRLERSQVVTPDTGGSQVNEARTSMGMFFGRGESELISRIEQRIATVVSWPVERGEGLQILKYTSGAEYKPHFDYFDPSNSGTKHILQRGGQRVGTLVIYLREPDGGGATTFPDVGFEVAALQGNAVFFGYDTPHKSTGSLHGGAPVVAGEKWVATKWLRQRTFI